MSLDSRTADFCIRDSGISPGFLTSLSQRAPKTTLGYINRLTALRSDPRELSALGPMPQADEAAQIQAYYGALAAQLERDRAQIKTAVELEKKKHFAVLMQHARGFEQRFGIEGQLKTKQGDYEIRPIGFLEEGPDYSKACPDIPRASTMGINPIKQTSYFDQVIAFASPITKETKTSDLLLLELRHQGTGKTHFALTAGGRDWIFDQFNFNFDDAELALIDQKQEQGLLDENYRHDITDLAAYQNKAQALIASFGADKKIGDLEPAQLAQVDALLFEALGLASAQELSQYLQSIFFKHLSFSERKLKTKTFYDNLRHNFAPVIFKNPEVLKQRGGAHALELLSPILIDRLYLLMVGDASLQYVHNFWKAVFPRIAKNPYSQANFNFTCERDHRSAATEISNFADFTKEFADAQKNYHHAGSDSGFFQKLVDMLNEDPAAIKARYQALLADLAAAPPGLDVNKLVEQVESKYLGIANLFNNFDENSFANLGVQERHDLVAAVLSLDIQARAFLRNKKPGQWTAAEQAIVPRIQAMSQSLVEELSIMQLAQGRCLCFLPTAAAHGAAGQQKQGQREWNFFIVREDQVGMSLEPLRNTVKLKQSGLNQRNLELITNLAGSGELNFSNEKLLKLIAAGLRRKESSLDQTAFVENFTRVIMKICQGDTDLRAVLTYERAGELLDPKLLTQTRDLNCLSLNNGEIAQNSRIDTSVHELALLLEQNRSRKAFEAAEEFFLASTLTTDLQEQGLTELGALFSQGLVDFQIMKNLSSLAKAQALAPEQKQALLKFYLQLCQLQEQKFELKQFAEPSSEPRILEKFPTVYRAMMNSFAQLLVLAQIEAKQLPADLVTELNSFVSDLNQAIKADPEALLLVSNLLRARSLCSRTDQMIHRLKFGHLEQATKASLVSKLPTALEANLYLETFAQPRRAKYKDGSHLRITWQNMLHLQESCDGIKATSSLQSFPREQYPIRRFEGRTQVTQKLTKTNFFEDKASTVFKICPHCINRSNAQLEEARDLKDENYWHIVEGGQ
ncbi:MAG: hypothetical protein OXU45_04010 [Candidatus Melainabacteria bacterium]|nr:hypothetical protein [Candidatus Melainabacteria bacterium]